MAKSWHQRLPTYFAKILLILARSHCFSQKSDKRKRKNKK